MIFEFLMITFAKMSWNKLYSLSESLISQLSRETIPLIFYILKIRDVCIIPRSLLNFVLMILIVASLLSHISAKFCEMYSKRLDSMSAVELSNQRKLSVID